MCGIIGGVAQANVENLLVEGLKRLEYRGYDSAGVALIDKDAQLIRVRVEGKVDKLKQALKDKKPTGFTGIAHTRWATHGKPTEQNAHPHTSHKHLGVVHNGIIENHESLKKFLKSKGYEFFSETDSEVAAHLIHYHYIQENQNLLKALQMACCELEGAYSLGVVHASHPQQLFAARKGSPLILGIGDNAHFIASDTLALTHYAKQVIYLEDGDVAQLTAETYTIYDKSGTSTTRKQHALSSATNAVDKGLFKHFMLKEIFEQGEVLSATCEGRIASLEVLKQSLGYEAWAQFNQIKQIQIVACGTSYHAGMVAKYWFESYAKIPTQIEIASEYRYRDIVVSEGTLFITVSQSGETADTLAALTKAKALNYLTTFAICNVASSTLVRESQHVFLTRAGTEIGVASTKAFTSQLTAFLMICAALSPKELGDKILLELKKLPAICHKALRMNEVIESLAQNFVQKEHTLFLGRGVQYPVALEGALKLKEISYIHAEAYPAGELKHGPLALVDDNMPVVAIAPNDELLEKLKSNLHEVSARGGRLYVFVDDSKVWPQNGTTHIPVPTCSNIIAPIVYTIPLQLLAYHVAVVKGTDVDQPRNLAKSVTVE